MKGCWKSLVADGTANECGGLALWKTLYELPQTEHYERVDSGVKAHLDTEAGKRYKKGR